MCSSVAISERLRVVEVVVEAVVVAEVVVVGVSVAAFVALVLLLQEVWSFFHHYAPLSFVVRSFSTLLMHFVIQKERVCAAHPVHCGHRVCGAVLWALGGGFLQHSVPTSHEDS